MMMQVGRMGSCATARCGLKSELPCLVPLPLLISFLNHGGSFKQLLVVDERRRRCGLAP